MDFIFKSSGVSRPLAHHDERKDNLNHTYYRDQINKVAIAIKDIVTAVKHMSVQSEVTKARPTPSVQPKTSMSIKKMVIPAIIVVLLAIIRYGTTVFLKQNNTKAAVARANETGL